MSLKGKSFSKRHGHSIQEREITVREDAPKELREYVIATAYDKEMRAGILRSVICKALRKLPDSNNWSEPNVAQENRELIENCEWYFIYDIIELIYRRLLADDEAVAQEFETDVNDFFRLNGIGWQLIDGEIQMRGPQAFESLVRGAVQGLEKAGKPTAMQEIDEALKDLSRRPKADITGAIQHGMASLECLAREVCGDHKLTLGEIIKKHNGLFPKPLDEGITKTWGYASEMARHIREGRVPTREEAELVVGLSATVINYLIKKIV